MNGLSESARRRWPESTPEYATQRQGEAGGSTNSAIATTFQTRPNEGMAPKAKTKQERTSGGDVQPTSSNSRPKRADARAKSLLRSKTKPRDPSEKTNIRHKRRLYAESADSQVTQVRNRLSGRGNAHQAGRMRDAFLREEGNSARPLNGYNDDVALAPR